MVSVFSLWLPILVSGVLVFVASCVIHMVLNYHRHDYRALPDEDGVMEALRGFDIPGGTYSVPHAASDEVLRSEAFQEKVRRGPVAFMTVLPAGHPLMRRSQLVQWFVYSLVVGLFTAYVAGLALGPGAEYMQVFKITSVAAAMGYALAHAQDAIWTFQGWPATARSMFDGLVYGLVTGGAFGWLWP
ncbi:hypothetical protein [Candidatus Palauibacter sp.]|uniref:hypothetical protein n=1 Tax=Candidatus Palauibacter sp. TaxID=3101350 RepID=UPI003B5B7D0A